MGSKKDKGARTPYETPNTASSAQSLRIIDAISEGLVAGFANGDDAPLKSVFFNDTPVQNADGSYNFNGVTAFFQRGEPDQSYVPDFDSTERTVAVSASVKRNTPVVRAITDNTVNRLRVTVGVSRNLRMESNGDVLAADTQLVIELLNHQGAVAEKTVRFTEKGSGDFYQDVVFDNLPAVPFNLRVSRLTADSNSDKISNNTFFASYVEIVDAKLCYPHTALAALKIDSEQFGNNVPTRNYLLKGKIVQIPSNYDPETRTYSGSLWDGSFKSGWTNNPAWVFYDLLTNPRYSTLARRLNVADIDKWSLYQVARYCDELVDDGFGGKEPRFVCNAYISEQRQAGELLQDLASVFTGLPIWNGNQVSVVLDKHSDPVASYTNANVKDGVFSYAGASMKAIHTAIHVQYVDKHDGYRSKTEYVADDDAIARYGLNIKQITAFGCDTRSQAARVGLWVLQTELRQQNTVSFTVGRAGLQHLPYDIIQIADNDYAGATIAGRVEAVAGRKVRFDRKVQNATGATLRYVAMQQNHDTTQVSVASVKIIKQHRDNIVELEKAVALPVGSEWVLSGSLKPRLYRAISIRENVDDGTYDITALLHDPNKYGVVDTGVAFDRHSTTLHGSTPELGNAAINTENGELLITWGNLSADGAVLDYDIKIYRNGALYRHIPDAATPEIRLNDLPNGDYVAYIRGRNARGVLSAPLVKGWSINYTITGLKTTPKTLAIELNWTLPEIVVANVHTEIWYASSNDFQAASKLAALPYPQNSYTLTGVGVIDRFYFWARLVDNNGLAGEFTAAVMGQSDPDPAPIVAQIQGSITKSALSHDLIAELESDDGSLAAAAKDAAAKVAAEAALRQQEIQAASAKAAADLLQTAQNLGNQIKAVETVNTQQAQQIQTVTTAQGNTAVALETEKRARLDGDKAEAAARATLAAKVGENTAAIRNEQQARVAADKVQTEQIQAVNTRLGAAESSITTLQKSVATQNSAMTTLQQNLTAKVDGLRVGGRNYLLQSKSSYSSYNSGVLQVFSCNNDALVAQKPKTLTISVYVEIVNNPTTAARVNNRLGLSTRIVYGDGSTQWFEIWNTQQNFSGRISKTITLPSNKTFAGINYASIQHRLKDAQSATVSNPKLEIGTVATDWTPAPEDLENAAQTVQANLDSYKIAQAKTDAAQTQEINTAKSQLANATAEIGSLKTTLSKQNEATATQINTLSAKLDGATFGTNLLANSDFADTRMTGWSMASWSSTNATVTWELQRKDATYTYSAETEQAGMFRYKKTAAEGETATYYNCYVSSTQYVSVSAGNVYQASALVAGTGLAQDIFVYIDFHDAAGKVISRSGRAINEKNAFGKNGLARDVIANQFVPLANFRKIWINETAPVGAVKAKFCVRYRFNTSGNRWGQLVRPQLVEVSSLNMAYVPYQNNQASGISSALAATVETTQSAISQLGGKVQAMYTVKTEVVANNRRVIAGLALGADGATGDSQMLVYANKFALVNPNKKSEIKAPFVITTVGNQAKMALSGDMIVDGLIQGKHIAASQTIQAPVIRGGEISGSRLTAPIISGGTLEIESIVGGNLYETLSAKPLQKTKMVFTFQAAKTPRRIKMTWDTSVVKHPDGSTSMLRGDWVTSMNLKNVTDASYHTGVIVATIPKGSVATVTFNIDQSQYSRFGGIDNVIQIEAFAQSSSSTISVA
ncbi:phage tail protein [Wielerella bovis]|uniref:TipJ family phage tail tip protein n=1 Tax=Wielerella bovis TaxID=2917790 RepID=UPI002018A30D|nr:phage tail protein [Wielerella bovis]ULJ64169.1 phage tail protein [Wielerella bovis]